MHVKCFNTFQKMDFGKEPPCLGLSDTGVNFTAPDYGEDGTGVLKTDWGPSGFNL